MKNRIALFILCSSLGALASGSPTGAFASDGQWQDFMSCREGHFLVQKLAGQADIARFIIHDREQAERILSDLRSNPDFRPATALLVDGGDTLVVTDIPFKDNVIWNGRAGYPIFVYKDVLGQMALGWRQEKDGIYNHKWPLAESAELGGTNLCKFINQ